jgi:hypothetical protein
MTQELSHTISEVIPILYLSGADNEGIDRFIGPVIRFHNCLLRIYAGK